MMKIQRVVYFLGLPVALVLYVVNKKRAARRALKDAAGPFSVFEPEYTKASFEKDVSEYLSGTEVLSEMKTSKKLVLSKQISDKMIGLPSVKVSLSSFFSPLFAKLGIPCEVYRCTYHMGSGKWEIELRLSGAWRDDKFAAYVVAEIAPAREEFVN